MSVNRDDAAWLARALAATRPDEIDCDEWLARVGRLIDLRRAGRPLPSDLEPVLQHTEVCRECEEELRALLEALGDEAD